MSTSAATCRVRRPWRVGSTREFDSIGSRHQARLKLMREYSYRLDGPALHTQPNRMRRTAGTWSPCPATTEDPPRNGPDALPIQPAPVEPAQSSPQSAPLNTSDVAIGGDVSVIRRWPTFARRLPLLVPRELLHATPQSDANAVDRTVVDDLHFQRSLRDFKAVHLGETNPRSTPAELSTLISYRADRRRIVISNCGQFYSSECRGRDP